MIEVRVSRLAMDNTANAYVVVLQEATGVRMLPIWIGRAEAEAIARLLQGTPNERPLIHDLTRRLVDSLGARVVRVLVTHAENNTFFAQVVVESDGVERIVDARPSDAIALALRCEATILVAEPLLALYPAMRDDGDVTAADQAVEDLGTTPGDAPSDADADADADGRRSADDESGTDPTEGDTGGYRTPPASDTRGPTDLQRYLEKLRPEDFGKFRL